MEPARTAVKNVILAGETTAKFISTKDQVVTGRIVMASEGSKNFFGLKLNSSRYPGEQFTFNGKKTGIAFVTTTSRSVLGNFVQSNDFLLEESLLGGVLSTSWVLRNLAADKGRISGSGTKKIDGRDCYTIDYSKKGGGDLDVTFYFDKETFQHVRTEYKRISSAGIGVRPEESSGKSESRFKLTEDFSDFKTEIGLTLPRKYRIHYSATGTGGTTEIEWSFVFSEIAFNQNLDPATFSSPANK